METAMNPLNKLGLQMQASLAENVPPELVAAILTTTHSGRLQAFFQATSRRLLAAHLHAKQRPASTHALHQRNREKALLDLVRSRIAAIGHRKTTVETMLSLMDRKPLRNVAPIRKAA